MVAKKMAKWLFSAMHRSCAGAWWSSVCKRESEGEFSGEGEREKIQRKKRKVKGKEKKIGKYEAKLCGPNSSRQLKCLGLVMWPTMSLLFFFSFYKIGIYLNNNIY